MLRAALPTSVHAHGLTTRREPSGGQAPAALVAPASSRGTAGRAPLRWRSPPHPGSRFAAWVCACAGVSRTSCRCSARDQPASRDPCHPRVDGPDTGEISARKTARGPPQAPRACNSGGSSCSAAAPAPQAGSRPHTAQQLAHMECGMHTRTPHDPAAPPAHTAMAPGEGDGCQLPRPLALISPMGAWRPPLAALPCDPPACP